MASEPVTAGELAGNLRTIADILDRVATQPYGPEAEEAEQRVAGEFFLGVTGDRDKALAAWAEMVRGFGGYMPHAAARALVCAKFAVDFIVPDAAPEVS